MNQLAGLWANAESARRNAASRARAAEKPATDPREAHDCAALSKSFSKEAAALELAANENDFLIAEIERVIETIRRSKHQTADRMLAMRKLEDASMRLRRENGDKTI